MAAAPTGVAGMARRDPVARISRVGAGDTHTHGRCPRDGRRQVCEARRRTRLSDRRMAELPDVEADPKAARGGRWRCGRLDSAGDWSRRRQVRVGGCVCKCCCGLDVESRGRIWCRKDMGIVYCDVMMG
ncbi:glycine-rich cell wall structural protein-like [Iris pallida]|uniref:Glycine-rich cell wall structural protein-like n=1 Tax=Iris pallida TaxID=29817 RepID=A0AAX6E881_IRIPA|nr:glycine-rich cell wall structural protein-like [Iris pallida]